VFVLSSSWSASVDFPWSMCACSGQAEQRIRTAGTLHAKHVSTHDDAKVADIGHWYLKACTRTMLEGCPATDSLFDGDIAHRGRTGCHTFLTPGYSAAGPPLSISASGKTLTAATAHLVALRLLRLLFSGNAALAACTVV
jgi:hypothetical protein